MFSGNDFPVGPNNQFPKQRIDTSGNMIAPAVDVVGSYMNSPVANLPTIEKEYSSVVNRAKRHMAFGQRKVDRVRERGVRMKNIKMKLREPQMF
jgi:hypothetical protein